jgi:hypothetical protein
MGVIRERWVMLVCVLGSDTRVRSKATSHTRGVNINIVEDVGLRHRYGKRARGCI